MLINNHAVIVIGRVERDTGVRKAQDPCEVLLAFLNRTRPQVCTVELQDVERAQGGRVVVSARAKQVENGEAVTIRYDGLAVDNAAIGGQSYNGIHDQW